MPDMTTQDAVSSEPLEERLSQLVVGHDERSKVFDPVSGIGGVISWISSQPRVEPASFCRELESQLSGGRAIMPAPDWIRSHGGLIAHLEVVRFESGLLAANIHTENHSTMFYNGTITECRGMRNGLPVVDVPLQLRGLMMDGFAIDIWPQEVVTNVGTLYAYATRGVKTIKVNGSGLVPGADATLTYGILRMSTPDFVSEYAPKLIVAEVDISDGSSKFGISLTVQPEVKFQLAYGAAPAPVHEFDFDVSGSLAGVVLVKFREGLPEKAPLDAKNWATAFNACFGTKSSYPVPPIDVAASLLKMMGPFTNPPAQPPASAAASHGKSPLEQFIAYKPAQ